MLTRCLCVLALSSSLSACSKSSAEPAHDPAEQTPAVVEPQEEAAPVADATPTPPTAAGSGGGCSEADLSLPTSMVVGKVNGETISVSDFADEAVDAEQEARREYCNQVDRIRSSALQRAIDDKLLAAAATKAGKDVDQYIQGRLSELAVEPTDEEVATFYEANKKPEAPPLELVADQVKGSMMQDRSRAAFAKLIEELESAAEVERSLPDVRPPALAVDIPPHAATFGPVGAAVEIVEFSDFECPYCASAAEAVKAVKNTYADQVRFAYRNYPLSFHPSAKIAATYAQCAQRQGKFWPMHDEIFGLEALDGESLRKAATDVGLDQGKLDACLDSPEVQDEIAADMRKASEVGVGGTPTFFINGRLFNGAPTAEGLGQAIEDELARASSSSALAAP